MNQKISPREDLERLKSSFDGAFQEVTLPSGGDLPHFLIVHAARAIFALDLADLAGVILAPRIIPVPPQKPGLLGLAAVKGRLVSVYSLAYLVGAEDTDGEPHRWIALCRRADTIGLGFAELERIHVVPRSAILPVTAGAPRHAAALIAAGPSPICLLSLSSIAETITALPLRRTPEKEIK